MTKLPYKIQCKSTRVFFETIAAFDCEKAAVDYAGECALANIDFGYRVMRGRKTVAEFGPGQER